MLYAYEGSQTVTYPYLATGDPESPTVQPYTVSPGDLVDFGGCPPPADGHWSEQPAKGTPVVADPEREPVVADPEPEPAPAEPTPPPVPVAPPAAPEAPAPTTPDPAAAPSAQE